MSGILLALYFIAAPPADLLSGVTAGQITAQSGGKLIRWFSQGSAQIGSLATLNAPAKILADYQDEGFLRVVIEPNVIDNAVVYAPEALQIFVNGRKLSCRKEGDQRRIFYPILNNREPCER